LKVHKGKYVSGIGLQVRRERLIHKIQARNKQMAEATISSVTAEIPEDLPPTAPEQHYHISTDTRGKVRLSQWIDKNTSDPALLVCIH